MAFALPSGNDAGKSVVRMFEEIVVPGDFDHDDDVDQCDFGTLQGCLNVLITSPEEPCAPTDLNRDTIVDGRDVAAFAACMGGPGQPPACSP